LPLFERLFVKHGLPGCNDSGSSGTLYRHFPTRDALIEAVYRSEVEKLAAAGRSFAAAMPPIEALRTWMLLFSTICCQNQ
jgi:AcrR family transcriptional regulator